MTRAKADELEQGLRHQPHLPLGAGAARAPSWQTAVGAEPAEWFSFPYVGAPWHHECSSLRSRHATVSVVVPVWNSEETVERCLDAVGRSSLNRLAPSRLEVVVCDDGSTDASWQRVARARRDVDVVALRLTHRSQSAALNAGLERASGDVVVFCDSDMVLGCGALDELAARHERWSDALCFGFHSNIPPAAATASSTWSLMHLEACSRDPRVRFYLPTLVPNMLDASGWLLRLRSGRFMLDSRGGVWRRHRFVFGCLFSVRRELILENDGFPDILNGWGHNDLLVAARLEAAGAFLLPVASAWGHHVEHPIRQPDRWFQLRRNGLAYRELLERPPRRRDWRAAAQAELLKSTLLRRRDDAPTTEPARIDHDAAAFAAVGEWSQCLARAQAEGNDELVSEALFRLRRYDDEISCCGGGTIWRALSHHRLGNGHEARRALEAAATGDDTSAYALTASGPELERLSRHYSEQEMRDIARLYRDLAEIIAAPARAAHDVGDADAVSASAFDPELHARFRAGAQASAVVVVPAAMELVRPQRVIDVGCGEGWFARKFAELGCSVDAVDAFVVEGRRDGVSWRRADLCDSGLDLGSDRYDLAVCLEVAEHLSFDCADALVDLLRTLAPVILFSAAIPGQRGHGHVNEQWPEFWAERFRPHGFVASEHLRWKLWDDEAVEPWYRQNLLVFADREWFAARKIEPTDRPRCVVHPTLFARHQAVWSGRRSG